MQVDLFSGVMVDSRDIAELTKKVHKHVNRDIEAMLSTLTHWAGISA